MKILMDIEQSILDKYSRHTGIQFGPIARAEDAVVVLLPGSDKLKEVYDLNLPVIIIAGNFYGDYKDLAKEAGFQDEVIIVKKEDAFCSLAGEFFFKGDGVKLNDLVALAEYAHKHDLRPEIYVWRDNDIVVYREKPQAEQRKANNTEQPKENTVKPKQQPDSNPGETKPRKVTKAITELIADAKRLIIVYKTVAEAESFEVAAAIANKQTALHINITSDAKRDLNNKLYAHSADGVTAELFAGYPNVIVLEADPDCISSELMQLSYDKADLIYHVPGQYQASKDPLKLWVQSGYKLDAIVATQEYDSFKNAYPEFTKTLNELLD